MTTIKKMTPAAGYHECSRCHSRIQDGEFYVRSGSTFTHSANCAPVAEALPTAPLARALKVHVDAGRLPTYGGREPLSAYEQEYEDEGK